MLGKRVLTRVKCKKIRNKKQEIRNKKINTPPNPQGIELKESQRIRIIA
jgi:hypothetical protein